MRIVRRVAVVVVVLAVGGAFLWSCRDDEPEAVPIPVAFVIERTIFTNDDREVAEYVAAVDDTLTHCALELEASCRVVSYASDAQEVTGQELPTAPEFSPDVGDFYNLNVEAKGLPQQLLDRRRAQRALDYKDALVEDIVAEQDGECLDPFDALRRALADLHGIEAEEKHIVVMGSGLWNCPPLRRLIEADGRLLPVAEAVEDVLDLVAPGSGQGVTFHFASFGRAFKKAYDPLTREEIQWLEDIWVELVDQWGGTVSRAPSAGFTFP